MRARNLFVGTDVVSQPRMLLLLKHTKLVRILLASLVIVASSGATVVLHRCQMEAASCCAPNHQMPHDGCEQPTAAQAGPSFKPDLICHVNLIAGGLALKQALLEKGHKQSSDIGVVLQVAAFNFHSLTQFDDSSQAYLAAGTISPPSVEKCVLFSSLLI